MPAGLAAGRAGGRVLLVGSGAGQARRRPLAGLVRPSPLGRAAGRPPRWSCSGSRPAQAGWAVAQPDHDDRIVALLPFDGPPNLARQPPTASCFAMTTTSD